MYVCMETLKPILTLTDNANTRLVYVYKKHTKKTDKKKTVNDRKIVKAKVVKAKRAVGIRM